jgi:hypothetical protein
VTHVTVVWIMAFLWKLWLRTFRRCDESEVPAPYSSKIGTSLRRNPNSQSKHGLKIDHIVIKNFSIGTSAERDDVEYWDVRFASVQPDRHRIRSIDMTDDER